MTRRCPGSGVGGGPGWAGEGEGGGKERHRGLRDTAAAQHAGQGPSRVVRAMPARRRWGHGAAWLRARAPINTRGCGPIDLPSQSDQWPGFIPPDGTAIIIEGTVSKEPQRKSKVTPSAKENDKSLASPGPRLANKKRRGWGGGREGNPSAA